MSYRSTRFDPAEFIVPPALGKDGRSERIQCYIQSGHARALNIIARSGVFPFEEKNDVVRYSLKKGLEHLDTIEPVLINSVMRRTNMMIAAAKDQIERMKFVEVFDELRTALNMARTDHDKAMAKDLYLYYKQQIHAMPDVPESQLRWKLKYLDELEAFKGLEKEE